jgi:hypothetical protein
MGLFLPTLKNGALENFEDIYETPNELQHIVPTNDNNTFSKSNQKQLLETKTVSSSVS